MASNNGIPATEIHLGEVGGNSKLITPSITVSTTPAYSSGDAIGGKITFTNAFRIATAGATAVVESLMVLDRANQKPAFNLIIFDSDPSAATITDNAAFAYSTDDLKVLGRIPVATTDYVTYNSKAIATIRGIGLVVTAAGASSSLWGAIVTTSTPTFAATTDFQIRLGLLRD